MVLLGALLLVRPAKADLPPPLFVVQTEAVVANRDQGNSPTLLLHSRDAAQLAGALGVVAPATLVEPIRYPLGAYPQLEADGDDKWLASSFVIDHAEPDVGNRYEEFLRTDSEGSSADRLTDFVATRMKESRSSPFKMASVVARELEGDCTEYSVLLTALARRAGIPARVVIGVAVLQSASSYQSFGHAWVEMLVDGRWQLFDAALHPPMPDDLQVAGYVRFGALDNEGPGYAVRLASLSRLWLTRVVVAHSGLPSAH